MKVALLRFNHPDTARAYRNALRDRMNAHTKQLTAQVLRDTVTAATGVAT